MLISNHLNYFSISGVLFSCSRYTTYFVIFHKIHLMLCSRCIKPSIIRYLHLTVKIIDTVCKILSRYYKNKHNFSLLNLNVLNGIVFFFIFMIISNIFLSFCFSKSHKWGSGWFIFLINSIYDIFHYWERHGNIHLLHRKALKLCYLSLWSQNYHVLHPVFWCLHMKSMLFVLIVSWVCLLKVATKTLFS